MALLKIGGNPGRSGRELFTWRGLAERLGKGNPQFQDCFRFFTLDSRLCQTVQRVKKLPIFYAEISE